MRFVQSAIRSSASRTIRQISGSPVNGDCLYAEYGSSATSASMALDRPDFETDEIRVSFLVRDSSGEHETGEPVRVDQPHHAEVSRICGRRTSARSSCSRHRRRPSAIRPTAPTPRSTAAAYEGPFEVPDGARLVLAIAERDGAASDLHRREVAEKPVDRPIDLSAPAVWRPAGGFNAVRLAAELDEYWSRKEALAAVLSYLATVDIDHWRDDATAARLVAGAVENDHV